MDNKDLPIWYNLCHGWWWPGDRRSQDISSHGIDQLLEYSSLSPRSVNSLRPSDAYSASELTIIGSDNGLSPGRRQVIIWTNAGLLLIQTLGTHFSEILGKIHTFSFKKLHLKMLSGKWRQIFLSLNVLIVSEWKNELQLHKGTSCLRWDSLSRKTKTSSFHRVSFNTANGLLGHQEPGHQQSW